MQYTENYNLKKPEYGDIADIPGDFNSNMDIIDEKFKEIEDEIKTAQIQTVGPITENIITINNSVKGQVSDIELNGNTRTNLCSISSTVIPSDTTTQVVYLKKNTNYTLSAFMDNTNGVSSGLRVRVATIDNTIFHVGNEILPGNKGISWLTFNTGDNSEFKVTMQRLGTDDDTIQKNVTQILLEEGTEVKSFITGTKSTVSAYRIKDTGKNLIRQQLYPVGKVTITENNDVFTLTWTAGFDAYISEENGKIKVPRNTTIYANVKSKYISAQLTFLVRDIYGNIITSKTLSNSTSFVDNKFTFNTGDNDYIIVKFIRSDASTGSMEIKEMQLGLSDFEYEPYKESTMYLQAEDENGNIIKLNSLPNGVKDKVSIADGKVAKNVCEKVLEASDIVSIYTSGTNVDMVYVDKTALTGYAFDGINGSNVQGSILVEGWNTDKDLSGGLWDNTAYIGYAVATVNADYITFIVEKGKYVDLSSAQADLAGTAIIYQLAEPKYYELKGTGNVQTYDGVTHVYFEPVIRFEAIADSNGQITIPHTEYPIDYIESVQEKIVDKDNISYVDTSYSQVDDTTIGGLTYGKKYQVIYFYPPELSTNGEKTITYPVNIAASLGSIQDLQEKLQEELGSVWLTLLPLADKELGMYMITEISTPATVTTEELGNKINEILSVWKG